MRSVHSLGALFGAALLILPASEVGARKKKDEAEAAAPAGKAADAKDAKVVTKDKTDLRAEGNDLAKVVKHLKKKDKLDYVSRSADGKWVQVRKGKVEGWVPADVLDGLPASDTAIAMGPVGSGGDKPGSDGKSGGGDTKSGGTDPKAVAAKPPEKPPEPVAPPVAATPPPSPEPVATPAPPPVVAQKDPPSEAGSDTAAEPTVPKLPRDGLRGFSLSIGGGAALLNSAMRGTTSSGLVPELYNYHVDMLPGLSLQTRVGYVFGYKWLRVGVDAGYRFAGGSSIVIQLPDRDSVPGKGQGGAATTVPLHTARQELPVTAHDADAGLSFGGYFRIAKRFEMSVRARGGLQVLGFIPEFNASTALPQELFYGPSVGGIIEFQSQFVPGFGLRVDGGYIPIGVRVENPGLRDADHKQSNGYYVGGGIAGRILPGFEVELTYRLLSTSSTYVEGSVPERLARDRDPEIQRLVKSGGETLTTGQRDTGLHSINLNLVFFRR